MAKITIPEGLRDEARRALDQGWTITRTGSGHLKWQPPGGRPFVITPATPSAGHRSILNSRALLAGAGLGPAGGRDRVPSPGRQARGPGRGGAGSPRPRDTVDSLVRLRDACHDQIAIYQGELRSSGEDLGAAARRHSGGLLSSGELQAARQAAAERASRAEDGIREQRAAIEKLNAQITRVIQAAPGQARPRPRPPARRVPREQAEHEL